MQRYKFLDTVNKDNWLINLLKPKTAGKLLIVLEESMEYNRFIEKLCGLGNTKTLNTCVQKSLRT